MFIGTSYPKLDDKFRLILPAKFRDRLSGGIILTKGQENCVVVLTRTEYERRAETLTKDVVVGTQEYRRLTRHYFGIAEEQTLDSQGRILIAQGLREWAGLGKDLVVAGAGKHIEIWNPEKHAQFMAASAEEFANYSEGEVEHF